MSARTIIVPRPNNPGSHITRFVRRTFPVSDKERRSLVKRMKCHYCKDKAIRASMLHMIRILPAGDADVFFREEEVIYDSQGTFRPRADDDEDEVSLREEEESTADDDDKTEIFVCEDHHRLWEIWYGGRSEGEVREEELKPEEREELEEATQEVHDEIEQIKERIRKKYEKEEKKDE